MRGGYKSVSRLSAFAATGENYINFIAPHMNLDLGEFGTEGQVANLRAVRDGTRVFSAYDLRAGICIWIITEADRSVTTILLPEEYKHSGGDARPGALPSG